ncbi:Protein of unknown function (DUF2953) [Melghirimyces profundicolus]|uniref:DUF2953 family protein n=1 Tax=Melghirimyces profundicolus TaxID=1242148 RepID=A0A2T6B463_9BACL|nr:DUF2953 domain-containing protein [Melghirimyces profundicolus]PTX50858.1 Protein of unknown function (DUF2953) [Melghirimyces profundicolus]
MDVIWKVPLMVFLGLLVIFPFTSIRIRVQYRRKGEKDHLELGWRLLFGLLRFRTVIPSFWLNWKGVSFRTEQEDRETAHKRRISLRMVRRFWSERSWIRRQIVSFHEIVTETYRRFLRHVVCERLVWNSRIGTGDAASTGVVTGIVWGVKTTLVGFTSPLLRWTDPPRLDVHPLFHEEKIETELDSIFRFRIGHAILAVIHLLIGMMRHKKGSEENWRNTQFRA